MNKTKLLIASFLTILVAGVGTAVRGGLLLEWGTAFGFTQTELGQITGGGFVGFGLVILVASAFLDRYGYKPFLLGAGVLHVLSVVVAVAATFVYNGSIETDPDFPARGPTSACSGASSSSRSQTASAKRSSTRWSRPCTARRRPTT